MKYHGSGYENFQDNFPLIEKTDKVALLENACSNGFQCLKVYKILEEKTISPGEFNFTVQFANDDGSLFKRGPCCGATEEDMPTQTDFEYLVEKRGDDYLVASQLVYIP